MKDMEILVTGCAGFIGSHMCDKLLNDDYNVVGIDNLVKDESYNNKKGNLEFLSKHENFRFYKNDITDYKKTALIFSKNSFDKIIHLAAKTGVRNSINQPIECTYNNVNGTLVLLELCSKYELSDFIFGSSSSVYGNIDEPFKEDMECSPISPYGLSKRTCEMYGQVFSSLHGINFISLRFFTVYGPRQREDMAIAKFVNNIVNDKPIQVYGDGNSKRDYTYIDDIVEGIKSVIDREFYFEILNIGSGRSTELTELIEIIEQILDKKATIEYDEKQQGDVDVTLANIAKSKDLIGYEPKIDIRTGIKRYIEWIKQKS